MKIKKTKYGKIILSLMEELYRNEVIDTNMKELMIGEGNEYVDKEDWIDSRLDAFVNKEEEDKK